MLNTTRYTTELNVRPDDIDMFRHVHSSKYIDYVLAARYDQMGSCYKMPMSEFMDNGFGWVISSCFIEYKRALTLGETFTVTTWVEALEGSTVKVNFEINKIKGNKLSCNGSFIYSLINLESTRAVIIPDWIIERYSISDN
ncbi:MAG: acyl-CoA thioesterase [Bacteroidia bacterium]|nr:acyl-CoA thioesterase [Bacteroidia bacterium]